MNTDAMQPMLTRDPKKIIEACLNALCDKGIYHASKVFSPTFSRQMLQHAQHRTYQSARVGADKKTLPSVRSDAISWLRDEEPQPIGQYVQFLHQLGAAISQDLYIFTNALEAHFSHYQSGSFYKRHIDNPKGSNKRKVTCILYLNEHWKIEHGGLLQYEQSNKTHRIAPTLGSFVCFLSEKIPHQVTVCTLERYALSGWLTNKVR